MLVITTILSIIGGIAVAIFALIAVALILNRKAVGKMYNAARSQVGAAGTAIDEANAVANMKQAVEDAKGEITNYTNALKKSEAQITSLGRQVAAGEREEKQLIARIQERSAEVGGNESDAVLLDLAKRLKKCRDELNTNRSQLQTQQDMHKNVLQQVKAAMIRADNLEQRASRMGVQLDLSKARAELAEVGLNFNKSSAHSSLDKAEEYEKIIQRKIDENDAALKVASDLSPNSTASKQWEEDTDAKALLRELGVTKKD